MFTRGATTQASAAATRGGQSEWERLKREGAPVNPCNSPHHPASKAGVTLPQPGAAELSLQAAYDPQGICFACGACPAVKLVYLSVALARC